MTRDHYENLYCQILGSKIFHLIPPTEYPCLRGPPHSSYAAINPPPEQRFPSARWAPSPCYPNTFEIIPQQGSTVPWLKIDPRTIITNNIDDPLLQACKPLVITIHPGQVLYLPALWFHSVAQTPDTNGLCMAVNYWYNMDFAGPLYPLFKFLRHVCMIEEGRGEEIEEEDEWCRA